MSSKMEIPATLAACGAPKSDLAGASITSESKSSTELTQELIRSVFGRRYIVVREPIGNRFRQRAPSRIRAWRTT
jgi:hypothetical protein